MKCSLSSPVFLEHHLSAVGAAEGQPGQEGGGVVVVAEELRIAYGRLGANPVRNAVGAAHVLGCAPDQLT